MAQTDVLIEQEINEKLSKAFNKAFENKNGIDFAELINKILPSVMKKDILIMGGAEWNNNEGERQAKLWSGRLELSINSKGRFHISHKGKKFTLDKDDIDSNAWQNWRKEDRTIEEIREIIFGGRSLDPYPQESWNDKEIINSNWPDMKTTLGPVTLELGKIRSEDLSLFLEPGLEEIGKSYEILPRGIITLNKTEESVTLAFQIENKSQKIDKETNKPYKWGAWTIIPLVVSNDGTKEEPAELVGYPVKTSSEQNSINLDFTNKWNYIKLGNKGYIILNPFVFDTEEAEKCFYNNTNWIIMAWSGREDFLLMRTVYNHKDQLQIYNGQPEYLELEATGPVVKTGQKSTVVSKLQFIELSNMEGLSFKNFSKGSNFKKEFIEVLKAMEKISRNTPFLVKKDIL